MSQGELDAEALGHVAGGDASATIIAGVDLNFMENNIQDKLSLFVSNTQSIKKEFRLHDGMMKRMVALLYAQENKPVDCEAIWRCYSMIKKDTGAFSSFRGNTALCMAALLSLSPDPQGLFDATLKVHDLLRSVKLRTSDFLVMAAYEIATQADSAGYSNAVNRTRAFYDSMKARRFLTAGSSDYVFAAMLGLSDLDVMRGTDYVEQLHGRFKHEFSSKKSVQTLSQVLVLGGADDKAVEHVLTLRDAFKTEGIRMDKYYTLPTLGVLSLLPTELNTIVRDVGETQKTLQALKGLGSQEMLIFAAAIVACGHAESTENNVLAATLSTSLTSLINMIIAQQAAIAIIMMSTASSVTASSGS
ncbi:MAG: DUF4003 domain-containing protein [Peptococcaceae bacterium]|nr:DUF4003 domain-containing protein [Peptococcaceae bacterium]